MPKIPLKRVGQWYRGRFYHYTDDGYLINAATGRLHRVKYEKEVAPIPKGYVIHHIDHNRDNNDISNLLCCTVLEHNRIHFEGKKWDENDHRREAARQRILNRNNNNDETDAETTTEADT